MALLRCAILAFDVSNWIGVCNTALRRYRIWSILQVRRTSSEARASVCPVDGLRNARRTPENMGDKGPDCTAILELSRRGARLHMFDGW